MFHCRLQNHWLLLHVDLNWVVINNKTRTPNSGNIKGQKHQRSSMDLYYDTSLNILLIIFHMTEAMQTCSPSAWHHIMLLF